MAFVSEFLSFQLFLSSRLCNRIGFFFRPRNTLLLPARWTLLGDASIIEWIDYLL